MNEGKDRILITEDDISKLLIGIFHDPEVELMDWQMTRITGGLEVGSSIYRLAGHVITQSHEEPWSMIIKKSYQRRNSQIQMVFDIGSAKSRPINQNFWSNSQDISLHQINMLSTKIPMALFVSLWKMSRTNFSVPGRSINL